MGPDQPAQFIVFNVKEDVFDDKKRMDHERVCSAGRHLCEGDA